MIKLINNEKDLCKNKNKNKPIFNIFTDILWTFIINDLLSMRTDISLRTALDTFSMLKNIKLTGRYSLTPSCLHYVVKYLYGNHALFFCFQMSFDDSKKLYE